MANYDELTSKLEPMLERALNAWDNGDLVDAHAILMYMNGIRGSWFLCRLVDALHDMKPKLWCIAALADAYNDLGYGDILKRMLEHEPNSPTVNFAMAVFTAMCVRNTGQNCKFLWRSVDLDCAAAQWTMLQHMPWIHIENTVIQNKYNRVDLLRRAAEQNHTSAQRQLGRHYITEEDNTKEGYRWILRAAEQEDRQAEYNMGEYFSDSVVVKPDYKKALRWFLRSVQHNYRRGIPAVSRCLTLMDPPDFRLAVQIEDQLQPDEQSDMLVKARCKAIGRATTQ